jgi:ubiquinone biosynthesis accessory factor UbiK
MTFSGRESLDELAKRLADTLPPAVKAFGQDLEANFKAVLQSGLAKLDLVNRQEFDVQAALLQRTLARLEAMESKLKELEAALPRR